MIATHQLSKNFGAKAALTGIDSHIPDGSIYGLVGSNGAGKSTFLRLLAGIYRPDGGEVLVEDQPVFDNAAAKARLVLVPDELYFLPGASLWRMAELFAAAYANFDWPQLTALTARFALNPKQPLHTFSKGMRRQAALMLALCCQTQYLLLDETFDGLDPVMRNLARQLIYDAVCQRGLTVVLSSHSLRELEDTCDQLALLHQGGLVLQSDVDSLHTGLCKAQVVLPLPFDRASFADTGLEIVRYTQHGSVANLVFRAGREEALAKLRVLQPQLCELLPLTLEEVFVQEMEARGYTAEQPAPPEEEA